VNFKDRLQSKQMFSRTFSEQSLSPLSILVSQKSTQTRQIESYY